MTVSKMWQITQNFEQKSKQKLLWEFLIARCFFVPHTLLAMTDSFPLFFNITKWQTAFPTGPQLLKNQTFSKFLWSRVKQFCGTRNIHVGWGESEAEQRGLVLLPLRLCNLSCPQGTSISPVPYRGLSFHLEIQLSTKNANIALARHNPGKSSSITEEYFKKNVPKLCK